jgi:hypothetical protein
MEIYSEDEWPNVYLTLKNKNDRFNPTTINQWIKYINKTI